MTETGFPDCRLYIGSGDGIRVAHLGEEALTIEQTGIEGQNVRDIAVHPDDPSDVFVGCGLRGWGLHHTTDGGRSFDTLGFEDRWVWGITRHPTDPRTLYVGTEPPMLYVSTDNGETFDSIDTIEEVDSREQWAFFHEPFYAGHIHGIDIHPERPQRIVAGVEHGALLISEDEGQTWRERLVGQDLHRVRSHPVDPSQLFAATGAGLYHSEDGGRSWYSVESLRGRYLHSIVFDSTRPQRLYVYADRDGEPLYRSDDGGATWSQIGEGLPAARPADNLRLHPTDADTIFYAGDCSERMSQLFVSTDAGGSWHEIGEPVEKVWRVALAPRE